ncbi:hypothetical protein HMPREF1039_0882 [Megasphaera lornae]|uniref:Uncharacterized protein n=1 Tax=Megasphaera lornae TaxID=1000568 RepID=A0ABN0CZ21_9FIRM|nr:hypothetical protein HMPREF1039_0882 [Megasphaera lornae]
MYAKREGRTGLQCGSGDVRRSRRRQRFQTGKSGCLLKKIMIFYK